MHKSRTVRLNALSRVRLLEEQRAQIAVEKAGAALQSAVEEHRQADDRVERVTDWKAGLTRNQDAWIGVYEQGLLAEQDLVLAAEQSAGASRLAELQHRDQATYLLQASRNVKVVERRSERRERQQLQWLEQSMADMAADMWLSRRFYADR